MKHSLTEETFDSIHSYWLDAKYPLNWDCLFVLPTWLQVWWDEFGGKSSLFLRSVWQGDDLIGISPLMVDGASASFIGDPDVCDYQDFTTTPGKEHEFFDALLDGLDQQGVTRLDLRALRPDSLVIKYLVNIAQSRGCNVSCSPDGVSLELELPATWDEYLKMLKGKYRHETRRKLRRLYEAGEITYRILEDFADIKDSMDTFLELFRESRDDKTSFMTSRMEAFFLTLASSMSELKLLKLCFLELNKQPTAAIMCFDYNDNYYLYNNGFDPQFRPLSVGLLSKALSIQDSIQKGRKKFDFLKGEETYKRHMGGKEVPLSRCRIQVK